MKRTANNLDTRPYPNEHSCRLEDPNKYKKFSRVNCDQKHDGKCIDVIYGIKSEGGSEIQALRFPKENWTADEARKVCSARGGTFEAAKEEKKKSSDDIQMQTRDITTRIYQLRADTLDEKTRSIEAVIATENPVLVMDWNRWQVIEEVLLMNGCRMPENGQIPMLDTHDRSTVQKQLGSTRNLRTEGDKLIGQNYFSSSDEAEHAWTLVKEKHLKDNSIGYRVINSVVIEKGHEANVAGRVFRASPTRDLRVTTEWEVKENSVCPIAADEDAKNRFEQNITISKGEKTMDKKFREWLIARGENPDTLDDNRRTELKAEYDAEMKRSKPADPPDSGKERRGTKDDGQKGEQRISPPADPPAADPKVIAFEAIRMERQRVEAIKSLGGDDVPAEVISRCITDGSDIDKARAEVLTAVRSSRAKVAPNIEVLSGVNREILEDAMLLRAGSEDVVRSDKAKGEQRVEAARRYRDMTLIDVCRQALLFAGQAIPVGREEVIRAAFTTMELPIILGNIAKKSMLKGYTSVLSTWEKWCGVTSVSDFKEVTGARLTDTGQLEQVGNSGEVKYGGAAEEYEKYSVATYAKNFGITRQNIINDDLRALTTVPQAMGARARRKAGDLVYAHLLANGAMTDNVALFHADHKNLNTSAALAKDKLAAAIVALMKQTDKDNQPINVEPRILLVPPDLKFTALELLKSATLIIRGTTDAIVPSYNAMSDLNLEVVSEGRLSNLAYTNYSAVTWYLTGDPNIVDTIVVAFLNGRQEPTLEQFNAGPNVMGLIYRVFIDVGCKSLDHRGMQKNVG